MFKQLRDVINVEMRKCSVAEREAATVLVEPWWMADPPDPWYRYEEPGGWIDIPGVTPSEVMAANTPRRPPAATTTRSGPTPQRAAARYPTDAKPLTFSEVLKLKGAVRGREDNPTVARGHPQAEGGQHQPHGGGGGRAGNNMKGNRQVCRFWLKRQCRFGRGCRNLHS